MKKAFIFFSIFLAVFLAVNFFSGCQAKEEKGFLPALSLLEEGLKEKRISGPLGRFGWLRSWFLQEVEYDEAAKQSLMTLFFETTDYYILVKYDFRMVGFEWKEYGSLKIESLDKVDVEQPYRFWLRRFFFAAVH